MPKAVSPKNQLNKLKNMGIKIDKRTKERDIRAIENVGYYTLKEFAYPFLNQPNRLNFSKLILRYHQNKQLRSNVFTMLTSIEENLKSNISEMMGKKYGPFGYLRVKLWINRYDKNLPKPKKLQKNEKEIIKKHEKHNSQLKEDFANKDNMKNGLPTIWLVVHILTFGNIVYFIKEMSIHNKRKLANKYECTPTELVSWVINLNFVRNACAHEDDIIDLKLKTPPKIPKLFKGFIYKHKTVYSNSIARILFIMKYMILGSNTLNKNFKDIKNSCYKIIHRNNIGINYNDYFAHKLGFKNHHSLIGLMLTKSEFIYLMKHNDKR